MSDDLASIRHQLAKQAELLGREADLGAVERDFVTLDAEDQAADLKGSGRAKLFVQAPLGGADAGSKASMLKGLST